MFFYFRWYFIIFLNKWSALDLPRHDKESHYMALSPQKRKKTLYAKVRVSLMYLFFAKSSIFTVKAI